MGTIIIVPIYMHVCIYVCCRYWNIEENKMFLFHMKFQNRYRVNPLLRLWRKIPIGVLRSCCGDNNACQNIFWDFCVFPAAGHSKIGEDLKTNNLIRFNYKYFFILFTPILYLGNACIYIYKNIRFVVVFWHQLLNVRTCNIDNNSRYRSPFCSQRDNYMCNVLDDFVRTKSSACIPIIIYTSYYKAIKYTVIVVRKSK